MESFAADGFRNPAKFPTQTGFTNHVVAMILHDDLPFTHAESPYFAKLLKYIGCDFTLPSDTTVRKRLDVFKETMEKDLFAIISVSSSQVHARHTAFSCQVSLPF